MAQAQDFLNALGVQIRNIPPSKFPQRTPEDKWRGDERRRICTGCTLPQGCAFLQDCARALNAEQQEE